MPATWTSVADIGRTFNGVVFTPDDYLRVETNYVAALTAFVEEAGSPALQVVGLEPGEELTGRSSVLPFLPRHGLCEGGMVTLKDLEGPVRLILREEVWCDLRSPRVQLSFGWDFYSYVSSEDPSVDAIRRAEALGLFAERLERLPGGAGRS